MSTETQKQPEANAVSQSALIEPLGAETEITEQLKSFVRGLHCYDYGDTAPSVYGAFCRDKQEPLDWRKCVVCPKICSP